MFRFFLGCLSVLAIALFVSQAIAGNSMPVYNSGITISETVTTTSPASVENSEMQPLPGDKGVMVAPVDSSSAEVPVWEEDVEVEETEEQVLMKKKNPQAIT